MARGKLEFLGFFLVTLFFLSITAGGQTLSLKVEPFWSQQDLMANNKLINSIGGLLITHQATFHMKPPFYSGPMPLHYEAVSRDVVGGMGGSLSMPLMHDFGTWYNLFIYKDEDSLINRMPDGAVAVNKANNTVVAECKVMKLLNPSGKQLTGFEIAEIHYSQDGQRAIFTSTFVVDFPLGFKISEKETRGRKEKEYFFIWSCSLGGH